MLIPFLAASFIASRKRGPCWLSFTPAMSFWDPKRPPQCCYIGCAMHAVIGEDESLCGKHYRALTNPVWMKRKLATLSRTRLSMFERFFQRQVVSLIVGQFILGDGASDHCMCGRCQPLWIHNYWICPADFWGREIADRDFGYEDLSL